MDDIAFNQSPDRLCTLSSRPVYADWFPGERPATQPGGLG